VHPISKERAWHTLESPLRYLIFGGFSGLVVVPPAPNDLRHDPAEILMQMFAIESARIQAIRCENLKITKSC